MRSIIAQIEEICRKNLLTEKWLLVPTLRTGHQWLDRVAQNGQAVVNVHLQTVSRMAIEWIESQATQSYGKKMESLVGPFIVQKIWMKCVGSPTSYFNILSPNLKLFQRLFSTLESLRLADISPDALVEDHFESAQKRADIALLLSEYEQYIQRHRLLDRAEILKTALSIVERRETHRSPNAIWMVPELLDLSLLERKLIQKILPHRQIPISSSSIVEQTQKPTTNFDRLRWLPAPSEAPDPFPDDSVRIVTSIGETNEIRALFRRCLQEEIPLDTVEILYTDAETYFAQIYETGLALIPTDRQNTLPITFAEGIPVRYSRPGRLLHMWLEWMRSDYSQTLLIRMLDDDLLIHPLFETDNFRVDILILTLRSLAIGAKRDRYEIQIRQAIHSLEKQIQDSFSPSETPEQEESEYFTEIRQKMERLQLLQTIISDWFSILPSPHADSLTQIEAFETLFNRYSNCTTELDRNARNRILDELNACKNGLPDFGDDLPIDIPEWLASLPSSLKVLGSAPRAGCLHVAHYATGGHSGRLHTFIVGLDDSRFPGTGLQDPFLLDHEREKISPNLSTAFSHQRDTLGRFYQLLGRLHGQLTLSYSSYDLTDDREIYPSTIVLTTYRILSGNQDGDPSALVEWLPSPASFSPPDPMNPLNESEWWMGCMAQQPNRHNDFSDVVQRYSHIRNGSIAQQARLSSEFTEFDGWVPESGFDLDPIRPQGLIMSASRFETLGACPLRFFFANGLKLHPPDEIDIDPDRWLNPMQFGSLMHKIFEIFMRELIEQNQKPIYETHWPRLKQILDQCIQDYRDYVPPPNQSAWTRQYLELEQCAILFLKDEETHCQSNTPVFVETSIGFPLPNAPKTASSTPYTLTLSNGEPFRARGIIDRIDRIDRIGSEDEEAYAIWDYKSGSAYKYDRGDPFRQGRIMQHSLYYELMTRWLKTHVSPTATLRQFGYFFPSEKGKGERISWTEPELTERANLFRSLCQLIAQGIFAPTDNIEDCTFCDYQSICRDPARVVQSSLIKLSNPLNVRLQPMKELRCHE